MDGAPWTTDGVLAVPWVVENIGTWDVEDVQVRVRAVGSESDWQSVDYLPRGARRQGVALLPGSEGPVQVIVGGYRLP